MSPVQCPRQRLHYHVSPSSSPQTRPRPLSLISTNILIMSQLSQSSIHNIYQHQFNNAPPQNSTALHSNHHHLTSTPHTSHPRSPLSNNPLSLRPRLPLHNHRIPPTHNQHATSHLSLPPLTGPSPSLLGRFRLPTRPHYAPPHHLALHLPLLPSPPLSKRPKIIPPDNNCYPSSSSS